jgi:hypothetical protein
MRASLDGLQHEAEAGARPPFASRRGRDMFPQDGVPAHPSAVPDHLTPPTLAHVRRHLAQVERAVAAL